ncbi:hypothetical protein ACPF7Z_08465 [Halomonas sp. GXIMD04776]|uniref:hypothetical protein n=1 Tax=Halomonas sp. GXIMD04776 TaxID=3415605 RepID=UPI003C94EF7D
MSVLAQPVSNAKTDDILSLYQRLHDGLSDMVESGRLTQADIPDDYDWLVNEMLVPLANHPGHNRGESN